MPRASQLEVTAQALCGAPLTSGRLTTADAEHPQGRLRSAEPGQAAACCSTVADRTAVGSGCC